METQPTQHHQAAHAGQPTHPAHAHTTPPAQVDNRNWYDKIYKWILIIPAILLLFSVIHLIGFYNQNGDIIYKDVSLTGGTSVTVFDGKVDSAKLKISLSGEFSDMVVRDISDLRTGQKRGFTVETKSDIDKIKPALENYLGYNLTTDNSSIEFSGSTLSSGFYQQLKFAILLAFVFMAVVIFILFRTFVPSAAVILSAFADILFTLTVVNMMGTKLSTAGIIAFLMLIGYSVDTDILLTTRLLRKKEGTVNERIFDAFKTGMTMTFTAIAAVGASLVIIYGFSETLKQIFEIIMIGLGFDIFNTWVTNASILKWYVERKEARHS